MKKIYSKVNVVLLILGTVLISCNNNDDATTPPEPSKRYFRFSSCPESNHGNWQDSSFVAVTSNPKVIQKCLDELKLPEASRTLFPLGKIKQGSVSYNKNAEHEFNWHFEEEEWDMVELGIEIYDGCPYSDVELTNYAETVGSYGGWSNRVVEEVKNHTF